MWYRCLDVITFNLNSNAMKVMTWDISLPSNPRGNWSRLLLLIEFISAGSVPYSNIKPSSGLVGHHPDRQWFTLFVSECVLHQQTWIKSGKIVGRCLLLASIHPSAFLGLLKFDMNLRLALIGCRFQTPAGCNHQPFEHESCLHWLRLQGFCVSSVVVVH